MKISVKFKFQNEKKRIDLIYIKQNYVYDESVRHCRARVYWSAASERARMQPFISEPANGGWEQWSEYHLHCQLSNAHQSRLINGHRLS